LNSKVNEQTAKTGRLKRVKASKNNLIFQLKLRFIYIGKYISLNE
jgi:hypothetical protein